MVKLIKAIHQVEQKRSAAVRTLKMRFPDTISMARNAMRKLRLIARLNIPPGDPRP